MPKAVSPTPPPPARGGWQGGGEESIEEISWFPDVSVCCTYAAHSSVLASFGVRLIQLELRPRCHHLDCVGNQMPVFRWYFWPYAVIWMMLVAWKRSLGCLGVKMRVFVHILLLTRHRYLDFCWPDADTWSVLECRCRYLDCALLTPADMPIAPSCLRTRTCTRRHTGAFHLFQFCIQEEKITVVLTKEP
jgi:hypothetical protein